MKIPTIMDSDQEQIETLEASNGKVNNEVNDLSSKGVFIVTPNLQHLYHFYFTAVLHAVNFSFLLQLIFLSFCSFKPAFYFAFL